MNLLFFDTHLSQESTLAFADDLKQLPAITAIMVIAIIQPKFSRIKA